MTVLTNGRELKIVASSLGGGRISVEKIDDIETHFTGEYPTLIVHNLDQPGHVAEVASMLSHKSILPHLIYIEIKEVDMP